MGPRLASLLLAVALPLSGAGAGSRPPPDAAQDQILLAGEVDLARLVDLAAARLKLKVDYDAAALKGSVTLRTPGAISDAELWSLTNRVLAARGFTTVRSGIGEGISVVKLSDAASLAGVITLAPAEAPPRDVGFASVIVRVNAISAKQAVDALRLVLSKNGSAVAVAPEGPTTPREGAEAAGRAQAGGLLLLVSDLTAWLPGALDLLGKIDTASDTVVQEVATRHLPATQLAALMTQVAAKRELVSGEKIPGEVLPGPGGRAVLVVAPRRSLDHWLGLIERLDQREPVTSATYAPRRFAAPEVAKLIEQTVREGGPAAAGAPGDDRWRVVVDDLTGTLIVTASASQHAQVERLIERLDATPSGAARPVRAFPIRNRPVTQVVAMLGRLVESGVLTDREGAAPGPTIQELGSQRSPLLLENSLQVSPQPPPSPSPAPSPAPRAEAQPGLSLTADEPTNTLIAVGEPRLFSQLELLIAMLDKRQPQVMLRVMLVSLNEAQTFQLGVELERLLTAGDARIRLASLFGLSTAAGGAGSEFRSAGDAAGFSGTVLSPGDFSVVIRALTTINNGQSLSIPKVLVNNNEQAQFSSVLQQPFANTNISTTTTTTTSFGGTQDAGTTIAVRPQIADGDHLVLQYSLALSSFVGSPAAGGLPPPRQQNKVDSIATVPDGHTVVVDGLDMLTQARSESRVPFLGAIPLIGELFKSRNNNTGRSRFFVFIQPTVLRNETFEDLKYLGERDASAAGPGIDAGWPELKPRVIR